MKSILNYLKGNNIQESQKIDESAFTPEVRKQIQALRHKIENIVKKMDIGDLKLQRCSADTLYFGLDDSHRYDWYIKFNMFDLNQYTLEFGSIASYGSFTFEEEPYKMYRSIGVILDQESDLRAIASLFNDIKNILY